VGPGRLGSSLAAALAGAGFRVTHIVGRDGDAAATLAALPGATGASAASLDQAAAEADVLFLTVQDSLLAQVAASIPWHAQHTAVHCSGAVSLDVLAPAAAEGASVGCLHPLQSFPSRTPDPARFQEITCGIDGDDRAVAFLTGVARRIGAHTVPLTGVDRALYHSAAVFASNDVVALMSFAARAWVLAGLPAEQARTALAPLLTGAANNIRDAELPKALTGPVARGDVATVERHLAALAADSQLLDIYRRLGAELLGVAAIADPSARERLTKLFADPAS